MFHILEIILAGFITFLKTMIENTMRSSGIVAIEASEKKHQEKRRSGNQRHKEILTFFTFNNVPKYRIKHIF